MATTFRAQGLGGNELSRDLEALKPGLSKVLARVRREAAEKLVPPTRARMRYGPGPIDRKRPRRGGANDNDLPHIRDTIEAGRGGIIARHPAAVVWEHGGVISPNGSPIRIPSLEMAEGAAEANRADIERLMADLVDAELRRELG